MILGRYPAGTRWLSQGKTPPKKQPKKKKKPMMTWMIFHLNLDESHSFHMNIFIEPFSQMKKLN